VERITEHGNVFGITRKSQMRALKYLRYVFSLPDVMVRGINM